MLTNDAVSKMAELARTEGFDFYEVHTLWKALTDEVRTYKTYVDRRPHKKK
jgi:hypothetical protein